MLPYSTVLLSDSFPCLFAYPWYVCQSYLCAIACIVAHQTPSTSCVQNMYEYFLLAKALNYGSLSYNHPVLIVWKNRASSSNNSSDKLVSSWPKGSNIIGDRLIGTQHWKKNHYCLRKPDRSNWETCEKENSMYRVMMDCSTDLLQLKQCIEFLAASVISTFSRNQPLAVEEKK